MLNLAGRALPLIMLCGVSLRFNVLDGALLGSVSDKRGP